MIGRQGRKEARRNPPLLITLTVDTSKFARAMRAAKEALASVGFGAVAGCVPWAQITIDHVRREEERRANDRMDAMVFAYDALYRGRNIGGSFERIDTGGPAQRTSPRRDEYLSPDAH